MNGTEAKHSRSERVPSTWVNPRIGRLRGEPGDYFGGRDRNGALRVFAPVRGFLIDGLRPIMRSRALVSREERKLVSWGVPGWVGGSEGNFRL